MDGKTAIKYVRYRGEDGDIGRVERQQKFMKAMLAQVTSPGVIVRVPAIIKEVSAALKTDMSTSEMLNLAKLLNDAHKQGLKTDMVPGRPAYIADISYWLPDIVGLRQHIAEIQGGVLDGKNLAEARQLGEEYERSIPREMKVVEVPKTAQPAKPGATTPGAKPTDKPDAAKPTDKPDAAKQPAKPPLPGKLTVSVINASGSADAGNYVAATLKGQGLDVAGVTTSATPANRTVVICYTTSSTVINKLTGLPFKYALQVTKDDSRADQVTVLVGKDYISPW
jgi:hypothetical protein